MHTPIMGIVWVYPEDTVKGPHLKLWTLIMVTKKPSNDEDELGRSTKGSFTYLCIKHIRAEKKLKATIKLVMTKNDHWPLIGI